MTQRFAVTITPSPDMMRGYIEAALGYVDDLAGQPSDPQFCLEQARKEL